MMMKIRQLFSLNQQLSAAEADLKALRTSLSETQSNFDHLTAQYRALQQDYSELSQQYAEMRGNIGIIQALDDTGIEYKFNDLPISVLEQRIENIKTQMGDMIKSGQAIEQLKQYTVNGSLDKGARFQVNYGKNILIGFNSYVQQRAKSITSQNYNHTIDLIHKNFTKFNNQGKLCGISITPEYLELTIDLIQYQLNLKLQKQEEREKLRKERQILREQEQLLSEIAKEREKIAKERRYYQAILGETFDETKRDEILTTLSEIDKREDSINYREQHQRAGWLYCIHSPALPNMVKLGVTRRINPIDRVRELSGSGVPFPFECDGLVFSDDVFDLETKIHQYFDAYRVNKDNRHKEFFSVTPEIALEALRDEFHCEIHYFSDIIGNSEKFSENS